MNCPFCDETLIYDDDGIQYCPACGNDPTDYIGETIDNNENERDKGSN